MIQNGQVSERSARLIAASPRWCAGPAPTTVFALRDSDKERFAQLWPSARVSTHPSTKLAAPAVRNKHGNNTVVIASCRWSERSAIRQVISDLAPYNTPIVVAPRYPSEAAQWRGLLRADVEVVDTFGALPTLCASASLVVVGGTFCRKTGGHNPLEALLSGTPVVVGPHTHGIEELLHHFPEHAVMRWPHVRATPWPRVETRPRSEDVLEPIVSALLSNIDRDGDHS